MITTQHDQRANSKTMLAPEERSRVVCLIAVSVFFARESILVVFDCEFRQGVERYISPS
jgi:hypothetical protein